MAIYAVTRGFPKEEIYGLTSQLRRAGYSVPSNIVEGSARETQRDYLHFLYIARASLSEARYFVHLAHRLGYMNANQHNQLLNQADETARILAGLIRATESESNRIARLAARATSAVVLGLGLLFAK